jgi:hypothetical protein
MIEKKKGAGQKKKVGKSNLEDGTDNKDTAGLK